jgi:hypothetical protein
MVSEFFTARRIRENPHLPSFKSGGMVRLIAARGKAMNEATDDRKQRLETAHDSQSAHLLGVGDPSSAVRMRLAAVAGELRKAAETADGAREGLLKLALRFEQHAQPGDNQ